MKGCHLEKWLICGSVLYAIFSSNMSAAQVVGDTTLPTGERALVKGNPNFQINGGARRGGNLFHSFSQFSIPTGGSAYFNNALDVQNILTRVTGGSISNIDGVIGANGSANLFLINPNGIIFGPNTSLNIGGSFVASTASSIQFADGTEFSAVNPSASPLLTISVPTGLQFNGQQGDIVMQAAPQNPTTEVGDAGQLLGTAQPINQATDGTPFNAISGSLDNPNDVDLYQLYLKQGVPFSARMVNGYRVDSQLFLFDGNGLGLFNGGSSIPSYRIIPFYEPFIPATSGTYYLGISSRNEPRSSQGYIFDFLGHPLSDPQLPLSEWDSNTGIDSGPYTIALTTQTPLQMQPGRTLALVGGNINLQGGYLQAPGGRVELGGVTESGMVGLNVNGNTVDLNFPNQLACADVSLNESGINVTGADGSMRILARNIDISYSRLQMGIPADLRLPNTRTGDVELNATGSITLRNRSGLENSLAGQGTLGNINLIAGDRISLDDSSVRSTVQETGIGNAGEINITTGSLSLANLAQLFSETNGQGNAGSININARDTVFLSDSSSISNYVKSNGIGNAGEIRITTESLSSRGSSLSSSSYGQGNSSTVNIHARDTISFDGGSILTGLLSPGVGNSGAINITTGSLSFRGGGLSSSGTSRGNAGNITINARDTVSLTQGATLGTAAFTPQDLGNVNIYAGNSVSLDGGSIITTGFRGTLSPTPKSTAIGNAGNINITTGVFSLTHGSYLDSTTLGQGNAGSVNINARDRVIIDGESDLLFGIFRSTSVISTQVLSSPTPLGVDRAVGQGGDVTITTDSLFLTNGGSINTSTQGQGNSGRVTINARDSVQISGTAPSYPSYSPLFSSSFYNTYSGVTTSAQLGSVGDGGDVRIATGSLFVSDSGRISTTAQGQGKAGNIQIRARGTISFDGAQATSTLDAGAVGRGGNIDITAGALSLLNGAQLAAATSGNGDAGNITVSADTMSLSRGGQLLTTTFSTGQAGDITVNTPELRLSGADSGLFAQTTTAANAGNLTIQPRDHGQSVRVNLQDGAQVSASTSSSGRGGRLTITAPDSITLTGNGSVIAAETGGEGTGGNLFLTTGDLRIQNGAEVTVSSSGTGSAGILFVEANQIYLDNGGRIRADTSGGGGNINLRAPLILLRNGSSITTNARGINIPGGNIDIYTDNLVAVPSENSDISANSADFRGGNVTIRASGIFGVESRERVTPLSDITATGVSKGTVNIITPGIDPSRGLAELPTDVVDVSNAIAQGCRDVRGSSFVVTGRGGLPPTPQQALGDDPRWRDWRTPAVVSRQPNAAGNATLSPSANPARTKSARVEATGWVIEPDGKVILTASAPNVTSPNRWGQPVNCDGS
jgi:filamentous hemagglutinin family protein